LAPSLLFFNFALSFTLFQEYLVCSFAPFTNFIDFGLTAFLFQTFFFFSLALKFLVTFSLFSFFFF